MLCGYEKVPLVVWDLREKCAADAPQLIEHSFLGCGWFDCAIRASDARNQIPADSLSPEHYRWRLSRMYLCRGYKAREVRDRLGARRIRVFTHDSCLGLRT